MTILNQEFFKRPILPVCQNLLGKQLVRKTQNQTISLQINEIEAYDGPYDKACHGRFFRRPSRYRA